MKLTAMTSNTADSDERKISESELKSRQAEILAQSEAVTTSPSIKKTPPPHTHSDKATLSNNYLTASVEGKSFKNFKNNVFANILWL